MNDEESKENIKKSHTACKWKRMKTQANRTLRTKKKKNDLITQTKERNYLKLKESEMNKEIFFKKNTQNEAKIRVCFKI